MHAFIALARAFTAAACLDSIMLACPRLHSQSKSASVNLCSCCVTNAQSMCHTLTAAQASDTSSFCNKHRWPVMVAASLSLSMHNQLYPSQCCHWIQGCCIAVRTVEDVTACLADVEAAVSLGGWPSIPDFVLQVGMLKSKSSSSGCASCTQNFVLKQRLKQCMSTHVSVLLITHCTCEVLKSKQR